MCASSSPTYTYQQLKPSHLRAPFQLLTFSHPLHFLTHLSSNTILGTCIVCAPPNLNPLSLFPYFSHLHPSIPFPFIKQITPTTEKKKMAVQAPVFLDNLGFPANVSSQDWIGMAANPGFGLPVTFQNPVQPDALLNTATFAPSQNLQPLRFSNPLTDEFDRQTREIDAFLQSQNERLRSAIQQQNKKQIAAILRSIEPNVLDRVRKTEQDLARVTRRAKELEECLKRTSMEAEAWKRMSMENEAMVLGLNNMLGQARERLNWAASFGGPAQDAESVCECDWAGDNKTEKDVGVETRRMECKGCKTQRSCMVFLPCKHLCACRQCGRDLGKCPVCKSVKEGAIEVFYD